MKEAEELKKYEVLEPQHHNSCQTQHHVRTRYCEPRWFVSWIGQFLASFALSHFAITLHFWLRCTFLLDCFRPAGGGGMRGQTLQTCSSLRAEAPSLEQRSYLST